MFPKLDDFDLRAVRFPQGMESLISVNGRIIDDDVGESWEGPAIGKLAQENPVDGAQAEGVQGMEAKRSQV